MITVVVPVYNMARYLNRFMASIMEQDYQEYEIVLVDDGSTDNSGELCDQYAYSHSNVTVIHKQNGGLSSARNAGMDLVAGGFVTFPDPDDWVEPTYLKTFAELQKKHNADLVCTGYYIDYEDRTISGTSIRDEIVLTGKEAQKALLLPPRIKGFAWNKLYRCSIIKQEDLRFLDDVGTTEDLDFAFRYLSFCRKTCAALGNHTYHYYQHDGAVTHSSFLINHFRAINTYEKIIESEEDPQLTSAAKAEICNTAMNLIVAYSKSGYSDESIYSRLRGYIKENLHYYLNSDLYGIGRKVQAIIARFTPRLYARLK